MPIYLVNNLFVSEAARIRTGVPRSQTSSPNQARLQPRIWCNVIIFKSICLTEVLYSLMQKQIDMRKKIRRIGFDIGGVLSTHTDLVLDLIKALEQSTNWEIYYITDMPRESAEELLKLNNIKYNAINLLCADWAKYEGQCKAVIAKEHSLDVVVDDHLPYISDERIPLGLMVVPRNNLPYNSLSWKIKK